MKPEVKRAFDSGVRELRQRITQAEYKARVFSYQDAMDQLTWLLLDVRKLRDEMYNRQNQEELCLDETGSDKNADGMPA